MAIDVDDIYTQVLLRFGKPSVLSNKTFNLESSRVAVDDLKDRVRKGRVYCEYGSINLMGLPMQEMQRRLSIVAIERSCAKLINVRVLANGALTGQFAFAGPYKNEAFELIRDGQAYFSMRAYTDELYTGRVSVKQLITFDLTMATKETHGDVVMSLMPIPSFKVGGNKIAFTDNEALLLCAIIRHNPESGPPEVATLSKLLYGHPDACRQVILALARRVRAKLRASGSMYAIHLSSSGAISFVRRRD